MNIFRYRKFQNHIIITAVRWYLRYGISYRDLEDMMLERGIRIDHSTLNRWVLAYASKFAKKLRKYRRSLSSKTWYVDETYVKVKGRWHYLYRAVGKDGETIDFYFSAKRNIGEATHFLAELLKKISKQEHPKVINTDKHLSYPSAIDNLKKARLIRKNTVHRTSKYLNNRVESDHAKLKRLIKPTLGFKAFDSANATLTGLEMMRMFKKGQFIGARNVREEAVLFARALRA